MNIRKPHILLIILIFAIFILAPLCLFMVYFINYSISSSIEDWGSFGDFIGGILGPIIALIGTIILGYLTYMVSKQSSEENKNLFLFEQRVLAFHKVSVLLNEIQKCVNEIKIFNMTITRLGKVKDAENARKHSIENFENMLITFSKINVELKYFPLNYGHLFKYDFSSKEYMSLIKNSHDFFNSLNYSTLESSHNSSVSKDGDDLFKELKSFVLELKKEIN